MDSAARETAPYRVPNDLDPRAGRWQIKTNEKGLPAGMTLSCPCGCGVETRIVLQPTDAEESWVLSGPRFAPTLFPAVTFSAAHDARVPHWIGWLINGEWRDTRPRPTLRVANG